LHEAVERGGVALQHGFKLDPLAHRHDGDAVIADGSRDEDAVAGPGGVDGEGNPRRHHADTRSGNEYLVALAAVHNLGVARDQLDAGRGTRRPHGGDDAAQVVQRQAIFQDEGRRQVQRPGAADRQIVDGAVDGQLADVAAGEEQRPDHERIRREGKAQPFALEGRRVNVAWSSRAASTSPPKPARNTRWSRSADSRPPLPWPSRTRS
jgi:hypothetical protein